MVNGVLLAVSICAAVAAIYNGDALMALFAGGVAGAVIWLEIRELYRK